MDDASGIDLSLLEGIDEDLLVRLFEAGIRSREDLGAALVDGAARRRLAEKIQVPEQRLEILEHLNFRSPEDQTERLLTLERRLGEQAGLLAGEHRRVWRVAMIVTAVAVALAAATAFSLLRGRGVARDGGADQLTERLAQVERDLEAVRPLAANVAVADLMEALGGLGPAPGWNGPNRWTAADHRRVSALLGDEDDTLPERAASLVLARLTELENAPLDSLVPLTRARAAAAMLAEFPPLNGLSSVWDASAVLLRQRIRSRAHGLSPPDANDPQAIAAEPWPWTAPGFLTAEELLIRLESLPVQEDFIPLWAESLAGLRRAADRGRDSLGDQPEASARDYWIRRGELELAVAAAILGRDTLSPYNPQAPRAFIVQRRGFLERAERDAPGEARESLAWLLVEHDEALALLRWLRASPDRGADAVGKRWVAALALTDAARETNGHPPRPDELMTGRVEHALRVSGFAGVGDPWLHPRTRWEAGLRPLLTATRAAARSRAEAVPQSP